VTQQINLADPRLLPQTVAFGARHALIGVLAVLAFGALASGGLQVQAARLTAQTRVLPAAPVGATPAARGPVQVAAAIAAEIELLRQVEAGQRRMRDALDAGVAGVREGPAEYFVALSRQAQGAVWITAFGIGEDGSSLELEGRMTGPHLLADYLRRLNSEPRFRGRPFAQLSLNGVAPNDGGALPYTEFALRSTPVAAKGR